VERAEERFDVVVVGAGMAGVATAFALTERGVGRVAVLEEGPPLGLTSDKSTECWRNYWPGPDGDMLAFMDDSIRGLMRHAEASGDRFQLRQRGYLFATARDAEVGRLGAEADQFARYGGGALRIDAADYRASPAAGFDRTLDGADLITDPARIKTEFPYLASETAGVLHVRRCGALSAQQLGMYFLETARERGARLIAGQFDGIETAGGRLAGVRYAAAEGSRTIAADALVIAAGPHLKAVARAAGSELPVMVEKHVKISVADTLGVIARDAPLIIWNDPIDLPWSPDDREMLAEADDTRWLTETMPAGVHGRPVGAGDQVLMYWTYDCEALETPVFPVEPGPFLPEVTLRGMAVMVPGLRAYLDPMPQPYVDGGYYTKTADNRPLIGPLAVPGTFVCSAFSGYGIMAAPAAGELAAAHVTGGALPAYAAAFGRERFDDPDYVAQIAGLSAVGQL
jgi:glycine/D-amino acid oxidase-like deaminating enzyme